jgi:hypothetical protein
LLPTTEQELEEVQRQSWEEKERLSKQLEMERANNVVSAPASTDTRPSTQSVMRFFWWQSSVFSSALDVVKQQKLEMMKNIMRLQNAQKSRQKAQQTKREEYQQTKTKLEKEMAK